MSPIFIENSRVPVLLSKVSPIEIHAISLVFFVFCRGELSEITRRHETIHFRQWLELLIIGFACLYVGTWLWFRLVKRYSGELAYRSIPFEQEAYDNQGDPDYLNSRSCYAWVKYLRPNRDPNDEARRT
jgi:hypothetical protein